jgi:hypothetical protein
MYFRDELPLCSTVPDCQSTRAADAGEVATGDHDFLVYIAEHEGARRSEIADLREAKPGFPPEQRATARKSLRGEPIERRGDSGSSMLPAPAEQSG